MTTSSQARRQYLAVAQMTLDCEDPCCQVFVTDDEETFIRVCAPHMEIVRRDYPLVLATLVPEGE